MATSVSEAVWVKRLSGNRAGRLLSQHLACLDLQTKGKRRDCAISEAMSNEKVFINALARSLARRLPLPCGLSQPLPRFIAILNLSGERSLVYSNNPALVRSLCSHSLSMHGAELSECLLEFETFPLMAQSEKASRFVLLTYSLPWQTGKDGCFWHLSACEVARAQDGTSSMLRDRVVHMSSVSSTSYKGKSVRDSSDQTVIIGPITHEKPLLQIVSDKQISDFTEAFSATNLDFEEDACAECAESPDAQGSKTALLAEMVQRLKQEHNQDLKEIKLLQEAKKSVEAVMELALEAADTNMKDQDTAHTRALAAQKKSAKDMLEASRLQNDAFAAEIVALKEANKKLSADKQQVIREQKKVDDKSKELQRKSDAKDALHNAALSKHVATISRLEGVVAANDERLASTKSQILKSNAAAVTKLVREHGEKVESLALALDSKKRIINQLSENNDRKDVEKESLKTHTDEQAVRIRDLETARTDMETEVKRREDELKKLTKEAAAAMAAESKTRNKSLGTQSRNASTATHHCASTQTTPPPAPPPGPPPAPSSLPATPPPEPVVAPTVGMQVVAVDNGSAQQAPPSYQAAIDMLQELVSMSAHGVAHAGVAVQTMPSGYAQPQPLPFPHFTPLGMFPPNGQFPQPVHPHPRFHVPSTHHPHFPVPTPHHHHNQQANHVHAKGYAR